MPRRTVKRHRIVGHRLGRGSPIIRRGVAPAQSPENG